ncbi:cytidine deaminase [Rhodovastum atsumiense]|uniref:cytidine deaminase n=1 Tax=Rhodovastum atsumiense TaxID=504468 RepID=UPI00193BF92A|nr:cytidine deaminase [Rhodovastum atsumiense]
MFDAPSPPPLPLDAADHDLIATARAVLERHYQPFRHTVAAALRSHDGRVWTGVHLGATVGRLQICAEAVALGRAVLEGDGSIATAVAVRHPKPEEDEQEIAVVSPCGACREMITDYAPHALVIVPYAAGLVKVLVGALLPLPYRR